MEINWDKVALFAGGALFGTAGVKLLGSRDAKKLYTHSAAAVLRMKECIMTVVTTVRENCEDVLADARQLNEDRIIAEEACFVEDCDPTCGKE